MRTLLSLISLALLSSILWHCAEAENPPAIEYTNFTLKMNQSTGESDITQLAYQCDECSFAQFEAIPVPDGWQKSPTQVLIVPGEMRSVPSFEGVPDTLDFVPEIPGEEFRLIAKVLDVTVLEFAPNGFMALAEVMRDTIFRYPAGSRIHELTDPDGNSYVLFAYEVESKEFTEPDFQDANALIDYPGPQGWVYTTEIIDEELVMEANGIANVLTIRRTPSSVWQKR